jgi:hypothetical protein
VSAVTYQKAMTPLSPEKLAELRRAAQARPAVPAVQDVPMGIRYKTGPAAPAPRPAERRPQPGWATLLAATPTEALEQLSGNSRTHQLPRTRAHRAPADTVPAAAAAAPRPRTERRPAPPAKRTRRPAAPQVLSSKDAYACLSCGSRYRFAVTDHRCGRLVAVTVAVTTRSRRPGRAPVGVLASYDTFACRECEGRYDSGDVEHGCGPLTPATVTITRRNGGEQA